MSVLSIPPEDVSNETLQAEIRNRMKGSVEEVAMHYLGLQDAGHLALDRQLQSIRLSLAAPHSAGAAALKDLQEIAENEKRTEHAMLPPLTTIFEEITSKSRTIFNPPLRKLVKACGTKVQHSTSSPFPIIPSRKPYFVLVDNDFDPENDELRWHRGVYAILDVERSRGQGPPTDATMVQAADDARLHMASHPFRLFSIVLSIHGDHFSIIIIDRGGVLYSPSMPFYTQNGLTFQFIAAIQQLCFKRTARELGLDPTATKVPPQHPNTFPTFRIRSPLQNSEEFTTVDIPISSNMSLCGRGSAVWRVHTDQSIDQGTVYILKTAWRDKRRMPEFSIYGILERLNIVGCPRIAAFVAGGEVRFDDGTFVSVNALRPRGAEIAEDIVLHRVVLSSVGKPLWQYKDELQFLRGILAAIRGISALEEYGVCHRDISAGNVLLSADENPRLGYEAFITDFEFASIPLEHRPDSQQQTGPRPTMTGTLQFMADEILGCLLDGQARDAGAPIPYATRHDLESLIYVMTYAGFRRVRDRARELAAQDRAAFDECFRASFSQLSLRGIRSARHDLVRADIVPEQVLRHLEEELRLVFVDMLAFVKRQHESFKPKLANIVGPGTMQTMQRVFPGRYPQEPQELKYQLTCAELDDYLVTYMQGFWPDEPIPSRP